MDLWWTGDAWVKVNTVTTPPRRSAPTLAYDTIRAELVLFGGYFASMDVTDTWAMQ